MESPEAPPRLCSLSVRDVPRPELVRPEARTVALDFSGRSKGCISLEKICHDMAVIAVAGQFFQEGAVALAGPGPGRLLWLAQ